MKPADARVVTTDDLGGVGDSMGTGGQASVYVVGDGHFLLKRYKPGVNVNSSGLDALVDWRWSLESSDRDFLDERCCWPQARVVDGDTTVGVVIRRAPDRFMATMSSGSKKLRELQFLFLVDRSRKVGIDVPEPRGRAEVLVEFAGLLSFLDGHGIVHGDLSMKNVLWDDPQSGEVSIFVLDCDGASIGEQPSPLPQVTTPGWTDPRLVRGLISAPDSHSDLYALGLSFYRCYYGHLGTLDVGTSTLKVPMWPPAPQSLLMMTRDTLSHNGARPSADAWRTELSELVEQLDDDLSDIGARYAQPVASTSRAAVSAPASSSPRIDAAAKTKLRGPLGAPSAPIDESRRKVLLAVAIGLLIGTIIAIIVVILATGANGLELLSHYSANSVTSLGGIGDGPLVR